MITRGQKIIEASGRHDDAMTAAISAFCVSLPSCPGMHADMAIEVFIADSAETK